MLESFQSVGTMADLSDQLNKFVKGALIELTVECNILLEISSGPVAVFSLRDWIERRTLSMEQENSESVGMVGDEDEPGDNEGSGLLGIVRKLENWSLRRLAFSSGVEACLEPECITAGILDLDLVRKR